MHTLFLDVIRPVISVPIVFFCLVAVIGLIIYDWQVDKSSFLQAARDHALSYIVGFVAGVFLVGWLLQRSWGPVLVAILIVVGVRFFWSLISKGIFKQK